MHGSLAPEIAIELIIQSIQPSGMVFTERIQALPLGTNPITAIQQGNQKAFTIVRRQRSLTTTFIQKAGHLNNSSIQRPSWTHSTRRG